MSKIYKTAATAQTQATKLSKKFDRAYMVVDMGDGTFTVQIDSPATEAAEATPGWTEVDTSVNEAADAEPRIETVPATPSRMTVTLTFPVTKVSSTYVGALRDGKEIWFDKKSLDALYIEDGLVTVQMARSKAVRRKLVQAAA